MDSPSPPASVFADRGDIPAAPVLRGVADERETTGDSMNETEAGSFDHQPVMADEIVELFASVPAGVVLDATLGGGGHSERLLSEYPNLQILGIDRDRQALAAATSRLARFEHRLRTAQVRFDDLTTAMEAFKIDHLSGALFDLGVSSPQLDQPARGFSYRLDGELDMRMDTDQSWSAADVVNGYPLERLAEVIRRYGDERFAMRIAAAIVDARPIENTARLAEVVVAAIPAPARRTGGHPAKRTFQAIRIEVNGELDALPDALDRAIAATEPGGRVVVLSYHSGEDRIVKERFRYAETGGCLCPPDLPCVCDAVQTVRTVRRTPRQPSAAEKASNRRATSVRLRVVEKILPRHRDRAIDGGR